MKDKDILKLLKPLKRKYFLTKLVNYIFHGIHYFSIILLLMILISKIMPIAYIMDKTIVLFIVTLLAIIVFSIYKRPKDMEFAGVVDSFGLKERVVTSLELKEESNSFSDIQKDDTIKHLKSEDLRDKIKIKYPKRSMLSSLVILAAAIIIANISTPAVIKAKDIEKDKAAIEEEKERIEKVMDEIKEDKLLTDVQKKEIEKKLQELKKTMDKSKKLKESDKDILKAKKELEKARDRLKEKQIEKLAKELAEKDLTKELSKAVIDKNKEDIAKEMERLEEKLKSMDKKDLEKAIKDLKELAESIEDKDIKEAIESLAENLGENLEDLAKSDIESEITNLSSELSDAVSSGTSQSAAVSYAISKLEGMASAGEISGKTDGEGSGETPGAGGGKGEGSGGGGQGGEGKGAGNGAGSGSDNGSEDGGKKPGSSGGTSSKDSKDGGEKTYEKIHTPKHQDGEGYDTQVSGEKGDRGNTDSTQVKKFGDRAGEEVPYNEVLNNYKKSAYEKINTKDIPPSMKEVVKKYFTGLE